MYLKQPLLKLIDKQKPLNSFRFNISPKLFSKLLSSIRGVCVGGGVLKYEIGIYLPRIV